MMEEYSVKYVGDLPLHRGSVDASALEGRSGGYGFLGGISVKPGVYECYKSISDDGKGVGAMMIVHSKYVGDKLEANERIGEITVAFSGVVGFFRTPKREYTANQLERYIHELTRRNVGNNEWHEINTKQFMCPSAQMPTSFISIYAHRDAEGEIDALQMEFRRKTERFLKAMEEATE